MAAVEHKWFVKWRTLPCGVLVSLSVLMSFGLSFLVVAWPLFLGAQRGHAELAGDIQNLTSTTILDLLVAAAVAPVDALAALSAGLSREVLVDSLFLTPSSGRFRRLLFGTAQAAEASVVAGFPNGQIAGFVGSDLGFIQSVGTLDGMVSLNTFNTDRVGSETSLNSTVSGYDVRTESWYIAATRENATSWRRKRKVVWVVSHLVSKSKFFGVTAARPIFYGSKLLAVMAMHFPLAALSHAMNATKIGTSGQAFVLDESGFVVGLSDAERYGLQLDRLVHATAIEDPLFGSLLDLLMKMSNGSYVAIPQVQGRQVLLTDRKYLLTTHLIASKELYWFGVVIVPRSDYFAEPERAFNLALLFAALAAAFLCGVMLWGTSLLHTHPLLRLAAGLETVANTCRVDEATEAISGSFIHEVSAVEKAYGRMVASLQKFSKYIPGPLVKELIRNDGEARPDVASKDCSFLFADIVGFVSIAESTPAMGLHKHLSEYFGEMEGILHELNGVATDFLGDGLFVFWNAPIDQPDHALLACEAALRQQARLETLRHEWILRDLPALHVRIGINTGTCLVGSFGSYHHLKYTAMGDAVNTASRLEQLNKFYETCIIIGEATFLKVRHEYLARPLDVVIVLGKTTAVKVYELICRLGDASENQIFLAGLSTRLLDAFLDADFRAVEEVASMILERTPEDVPTNLLLQRSRAQTSEKVSPRVAIDK
jgi:adenylate cyclase